MPPHTAHGMKRFWTCSLSVASTDVCVFGFCSSKGSTLSRRSVKKADISGKGEENGRGSDSQVPMEDLERNQKILQWMMEGEALRHKKNRYCNTPYTHITHVAPMVLSYLYEGPIKCNLKLMVVCFHVSLLILLVLLHWMI